MLKEVRWSPKKGGLGGALFALFLALAVVLAGGVPAQASATDPKVMTNHWKNGASEGYDLNFDVKDTATALISDVTVTGPGLSAPLALQRPSDQAPDLAGTAKLASAPKVGDSYTFTVNYVDANAGGSASETVTVPVNAVLNSFATPGTPNGPITTAANPSFNWTAPSSTPTTYNYRVYLEGTDGQWTSSSIASSTTSYSFPSTTFSPATAPTPGVLYDWSVSVVDASGNSSENWASSFMLWTNFTGKVTDLNGNGVAGVPVFVYDSLGNPAITNSLTQADGSYYFGGLASGKYLVAFGSGTSRIYYDNKLTTDQADLVPLTSGTLTNGVNAIYDNWGTISGKVINSTATGIAGVAVSLYDSNGNLVSSIPSAISKSDGTFVITPVPPATYMVKFSGGGAGYLDGWFANQSQISVTAHQTYDLPIDTVLYQAMLTGKVTDASGAALSGVWIWLYTDKNGSFATNLDGSYFNGAQSQADGSYAIGGLPTGTYYMLFEGPGTLPDQYYKSKSQLSAADPVLIGSTTTAGVNVAMTSGAPTVTAFSVPATSPALTLTGITFTATEPNGVSYLLTESSSAPAATAGWTTTAPTSYTFSSGGSKNLYGWVMGYTGNVVPAGSQAVTVSNVPLKAGDCDNNGSVDISEVQSAINMYLGLKAAAVCVDTDNSGSVDISEVQKTINSYLGL